MLEELTKIREPDAAAMENAAKRWKSIAKPLGGLGRLEDMVTQLAGIYGEAEHIRIEKKALLVFAGDHGVTESGVTQTDSSVTRTVTDNFAKGCSSTNYMAEVAGAKVFPVDVGMLGERYGKKQLRTDQVADRKVNTGTGNIEREAAMTAEECERAIRQGISCVRELKERGYQIIAIGEMGIGNTTPSSALAAVWLEKPVREVTGRGAGLSDAAYEKKCRVLEKVVDRRRKNREKEDKDGGQDKVREVIHTLSDIGGYEIAAMAGACLGGALYRIPIVLDGAISGISALAAVRLNERGKGYLIASHESSEPVGKLVLEALHKKPVIQCGMHLGEGSGAIALFPLLDMALSVYRNMKTFEENRIEAYVDYEKGKGQEGIKQA